MSTSSKTSQGREHAIIRGGRVTKLNGRDATCCPITGRLIASGSAMAMAAFFAIPATLGGATSAHAQALCTVGTGVIYTCTADSQDTQAIVATNEAATVNLDATTAIDTSLATGGTGGSAVVLNATGADGSIVLTQAASGLAIVGQVDGIAATTEEGLLSITTTGPVTGVTGFGIAAEAATGLDADVVIDAGNVTGAFDGIYVDGNEGSVSITSDGAITGIAGDGIVASNETSVDGALTIDVNDVTGAFNGIQAANNGGGDLSISSTGDITGQTRTGITALNSVDSNDLVMDVNNVTGATYGIFADNDGDGITSVTADGTVTGGTDAGISAVNSAAATLATDAVANVEVVASNVTGGTYGIYAENNGTGDLSVTATGDVTGLTQEGIYAYNSAAGNDLMVDVNNVTGATYGVHAANDGDGMTSVVADGTVVGETQSGILASNTTNAALATDADVNVEVVANNVTGATYGVEAYNNGTGDLSVSATGDVTGETNTGVYAYGSALGNDVMVDVNNVTGATYGIDAENYGTGDLSVTATGDVVGEANSGVYAYGASLGNDVMVDVNNVTGATYGVEAYNYGDGMTSVMADGTVVGESEVGVYVYNSSDANLATDADANVEVVANNVTGATYGIDAENYGTGDLSVTATGDVVGEANSGVYAYGASLGNDVMVDVNNVTGATYGVEAYNFGDGTTSVMADGTVVGEGEVGVYVYNSSDANLATDADANVEVVVNDVTGATYSISAENYGTGDLSVTATGDVVGEANSGVYAYNSSLGNDLMVDANNVTGATYGIEAYNNGDGMTSVMADGAVVGDGEAGVYVYNSAAATLATDADANVEVVVNDVTGETFGINAANYGTGDLSVTATGDVVGETETGIAAVNSAAGNDLMVDANSVSGGTTGIYAENNGDGMTSVMADGTVTGETQSGVYVYNSSAATLATDADANVEVVVADVAGATYGIDASNLGTGDLSITATGDVTGDSQSGIYAFNSAAGNDLMVDANNVTGGTDGIDANNNGDGMTSVMAEGTVVGETGTGIAAVNSAAATLATDADVNVEVVANDVTGAIDGIYAENNGTGDLSVTATGDVVGEANAGIYAINAETGNDLMIEANNVEGVVFGVNAVNNGDGMTSVTTDGLVTGATGINAVNATSTAGIMIDANDVTGDVNAIVASSPTGGDIVITTTGDVTSDTGNAIVATTTGVDSTITLNNTGTISTTNGDYAIFTSGAATDVNNNVGGTINGGVSLTAFNDRIGNAGTFNATADTMFGDGDDVLNNTGTLTLSGMVDMGAGNDQVLAGGTVAVSGDLLLGDGNDVLNNTGTFNLTGTVDAGAGDDSVVVGGTFTQNGELLLGDGNDTLTVNNTLNLMQNVDFGIGTDAFVNNGTTVVMGDRVLTGLETFTNDGVIDMADGAANDSLTIPGNYVGTGGSLEIDADFGANDADLLVIGGSATGSTDVVVNPIGTSNLGFNESLTIVDAGAGSTAGAFVIADDSEDIGFVSYDVVFNPTNNNYLLAAGASAGAFETSRIAAGANELWYRSADAVAAHLTASRTELSKGFWLNGYGIKSSVDDTVAYTAPFEQSYNLGYDQDFFGAQAGFDFGSDATRLGITGGILSSKLNFEASPTNVDYTAYNIGAYAAFNLGGLFANVLGKYDFIDGEVSAPTVGYGADLNGDAWGVRGEIGFRGGSENFFFEPVASLEYQRTSIDNFSALGADVDFDKFEGLRGMAGARVGTVSTIGNGNTLTIYGGAHAVHEFEGGNDVTLRIGDTAFTTVVDKRDTFARGEVGVAIDGTSGVSGFFAGTADFGGSDYKAYGVRGGINFKF